MKHVQIKVCPRWFARADIEAVTAVEAASFESPWSREDFAYCLGRDGCAAVVAEAAGKLSGFVIFEVVRRRVQLVNMAVHPRVRRSGVAGNMITWLVGRLNPGKSCLMVAQVRESNLSAQLFLKSAGFRAEQILPAHYDDTNEDAYEFHRHLQAVKKLGGKITG